MSVRVLMVLKAFLVDIVVYSGSVCGGFEADVVRLEPICEVIKVWRKSGLFKQ